MGGKNRPKGRHRDKDDDDFRELSRYESNHRHNGARQTEQETERHMVDLPTIANSGIQRLIENTKSVVSIVADLCNREPAKSEGIRHFFFS